MTDDLIEAVARAIGDSAGRRRVSWKPPTASKPKRQRFSGWRNKLNATGK